MDLRMSSSIHTDDDVGLVPQVKQGKGYICLDLNLVEDGISYERNVLSVFLADMARVEEFHRLLGEQLAEINGTVVTDLQELRDRVAS